tara:strand:- start:38 stop:1009 length:972 start_codon:yes stop_codon:yes gene_type:complete
MKRLLRQNSLFFLLLVISAIAHWAMGYLGGEEISTAELWQLEDGTTSVSVQLVTAVVPPPLEDLLPEIEPVETLTRIPPPMEMPPVTAPEAEAVELPPEQMQRSVEQQQPEMPDPLLIERHSDFQLQPAVAIEVPPQEKIQTTEQIQFTAPDRRRETEPMFSPLPVKRELLPVSRQLSETPARSEQEHPEVPPEEEIVPLPRQQRQSQPENTRVVSLPENAARTVISQGSTGVEVPPSIRNRRQPLYPQDLIAAGIEGRVMLLVDISETGRVLAMEIQSSSGHPRLDQSAMAAVRDWRFVPGRRDGRPSPMTVIVPVSFQVVR